MCIYELDNECMHIDVKSFLLSSSGVYRSRNSETKLCEHFVDALASSPSM